MAQKPFLLSAEVGVHVVHKRPYVARRAGVGFAFSVLYFAHRRGPVLLLGCSQPSAALACSLRCTAAEILFIVIREKPTS